MSSLQIYIEEEGLAAGKRVRQKILGTAAAGALGSAVWGIASQRQLTRTVPGVTANAAIAATAFSVCQESVRALRQGEDDAWNSFAAGALAGAALTRAAHGRGFHLLGMVVWGPICGTLHWLNNAIQPSLIFGSWLASKGLLDAPPNVAQHQQQPSAASLGSAGEHGAVAAGPVVVQPRRYEDITYSEKKQWVEQLRQRELEQLRMGMQKQEREALQDSGTRPQQQASGRKWWPWN